jgi:hypothetical protein
MALGTWLPPHRRPWSGGNEPRPQGFTGRLLDILIVADRGQWFVEAGPTAANRSFTLEVWSACLDEPVLFLDNRPALTDADRLERIAKSWHLTPQVDYLRTHLDDMVAACDPASMTETISRLECARDRLQRGS